MSSALGDKVEKKILVVAPHLLYPPRNGADIHIDRKWSEISRYFTSVDILATNSLNVYENGIKINSKEFDNNIRSRITSIFRCIFYKSHYLKEKFNTRNFREQLHLQLTEHKYDLVVCSFISTADMIIGQERTSQTPLYIETHNNEIKWFEDLSSRSSNFVIKIICKCSEGWLIKFLKKNAKKFTLINVTEADDEFYRASFGMKNTLVSPGGCDVNVNTDDVSTKYCRRSGAPRLLFVGSLSSTMNLDALKNFATKFVPVFDNEGLTYELRVVGSNPTGKVRFLCQEKGWSLFRDVTDDELGEHFDWADYAIMPFEYSNGNKLKLFSTLARGVPFLATSQINLPHSENLKCLSDDDPHRWIEMLLPHSLASHTSTDFAQLKELALNYSWTKLAKELSVKM